MLYEVITGRAAVGDVRDGVDRRAHRPVADDMEVDAEIVCVITSYSIHYTKLYELDHTGGVGEVVGAVLDAAVLHGHDLDVAAHPVGLPDLEVAELDILPGDVAVNTLADGAVGGLV